MTGPVHLPAVLGDQFGISRSEARRCLSQGGVRINGEVVYELDRGRDWLSLVQGGRVVTVMNFGKRIHRCPTCYLPMRYWFALDWFLCDLCGTCVTSERLEDRPRWRSWLDRLMGMEF